MSRRAKPCQPSYVRIWYHPLSCHKRFYFFPILIELKGSTANNVSLRLFAADADRSQTRHQIVRLAEGRAPDILIAKLTGIVLGGSRVTFAPTMPVIHKDGLVAREMVVALSFVAIFVPLNQILISDK